MIMGDAAGCVSSGPGPGPVFIIIQPDAINQAAYTDTGTSCVLYQSSAMLIFDFP
jgi:hypothetical protein